MRMINERCSENFGNSSTTGKQKGKTEGVNRLTTSFKVKYTTRQKPVFFEIVEMEMFIVPYGNELSAISFIFQEVFTGCDYHCYQPNRERERGSVLSLQ